MQNNYYMLLRFRVWGPSNSLRFRLEDLDLKLLRVPQDSAGIKINEKKGESARFLTIMISRGTIATSMALFPAVIQIWLCLPMH